MPIYAVYNLTSGEEAPTFHCVEGLVDLIDALLDEWVAGDVDMPGVMAFLRDHGVEPPMEDEDVLEGEFEEEIIGAADAVRALVSDTGSVAKEFVAAIAKGFRIEEMDGVDESLPENVHDYLVLFLTSGAFGGAPKGLTREAAQLWLKEPAHQRMVQEALTGWKPAEVAVMDGEDLAEILLVGPLWVGLMEMLRRA